MSDTTVLLDHAIVLVRDLRAAEAVLEGAGFALGRAGEHPGLGTHNRLVLFDDGPYLELLAVLTPLPDNAPYRALLADRACALGLALHSADALATWQRLTMAGLEPAPVIEASRPLPDGRIARFSLVRFGPGRLPAEFGFYCQHHTPQAVWEVPAARPARPAQRAEGRRIVAVAPAPDVAPLHPALAAETAVTPGCGAAPVVMQAPARHGWPVLQLNDGMRLVLGGDSLAVHAARP